MLRTRLLHMIAAHRSGTRGITNKPHTPARAAGASTRCSLRSTAGDSIAEVLVGVLIVALASVLFATMVSVATTISSEGAEHADNAYAQVSEVDAAVPAGDGTVIITASGLNTSFAVNVATSSPDSDSSNDEASYTFSRYELAQSGEGGGNE